MYKNKRIVIVLPAYNSARTLAKTYNEIPKDIVDEVILVDDYSKDETALIASNLGINHIITQEKNLGYGANQKTCYNKAVEIGADIVIMLHPDYQYTPKLIPAMVSLIESGLYKVVFGSRILGKGALNGGMPIYKYFCNRVLTFLQNLLMNQKLSEYHTGFRAYSCDVIRKINYKKNSDGFIFDNEMIAHLFHHGYEIAEITCPTRYSLDASSIDFVSSIKYGLGVLKVSFLYFLARKRLYKWRLLEE